MPKVNLIKSKLKYANKRDRHCPRHQEADINLLRYLNFCYITFPIRLRGFLIRFPTALFELWLCRPKEMTFGSAKARPLFRPQVEVCARKRSDPKPPRPKVPLIGPSQAKKTPDQTEACSTLSMRSKRARIRLWSDSSTLVPPSRPCNFDWKRSTVRSKWSGQRRFRGHISSCDCISLER